MGPLWNNLIKGPIENTTLFFGLYFGQFCTNPIDDVDDDDDDVTLGHYQFKVRISQWENASV